MIHRKYGIRALALRNLEQATGAVLRATLRPRPPEPREARWRDDRRRARPAMRARTTARWCTSDPDFPAYFRAATPIDVIERLRIGSRPTQARRRCAASASLRAIPWVFAWSQNRCRPDRLVRRRHARWQHGIARARPRGAGGDGARLAVLRARWSTTSRWCWPSPTSAIFERYSRAGRRRCTTRFFPGIAAEFERTRDAILAIKGSDELLADDYRLRQSIRLRNPYVDPISLLQVDLLRALARRRAARTTRCCRALVATVNGIAAGIQNTG